MYIAFKWLTGLALAMWIVMCCIDMFLKKNQEIYSSSTLQGVNVMPHGSIYRNISVPSIQKPDLPTEKYYNYSTYYQEQCLAVLHYIMFIAGALAVSLFHKKREIILYTQRKFSKINIQTVRLYFKCKKHFSKETAFKTRDAILKYSHILWENIRPMLLKLCKKIKLKVKQTDGQSKLHIMLIKKIREIKEERKNLSQLLIAAIQENKSIRMQYQLETMAKNRLVQHIEETQRRIKENRTRYLSFQHLYLVTHQENIFLKSRVRKLVKEKEDSEKNLMSLLNEIYKSENNDMKAFCRRFLIQTKDDLINSDVGAEVRKFLQNSNRVKVSASNWEMSDQTFEMNGAKSWPGCNTRIIEILQEENNVVPMVSDAPKLRGLPGEYVWTVKDKNGIIEKLYEYEPDFDNGDTIRRIREYSVYYDKDCLLDFSNSNTTVTENRNDIRLIKQSLSMDYPVTRQRFLTGSEVFQKFLENNSNVVHSTCSRTHVGIL